LTPDWKNGGTSFETAASRLPQDEAIFLMPSMISVILRSAVRRVSKDAGKAMQPSI
jgi:hypothetical protein